MFALRRRTGFGLMEFLAITVVVAVVVGLAMVYYAHKWSAAEGPGVTAAAPEWASTAGAASLQSYVVPLRTDAASSL